MNTNFRALAFGIVTATAMFFTINAVVAAERPEIVRLDGITVTAHRDNFDADGNLKVIRLDTITVTASKAGN